MSKQLPIEKQLNVIQASGLQDAYEYLLKQLCKKGLPTGNVYEFSAQTILKYEKKLKNQNIQLKAQAAAKDAHEKFIKKMQDKEERNLEQISKYELAFREEQKRKDQNQSISQEPFQRQSVGKQNIEQRNQSIEKIESPPKGQKKIPEIQASPKQQEKKVVKQEPEVPAQAQAQQPQQQPQTNTKKGAAIQSKKDTKKQSQNDQSSILKDLKLEEQKDQQKQQPLPVQQEQAQTKEPSKEQAKDVVKEQQKEPQQIKSDNKKGNKKK